MGTNIIRQMTNYWVNPLGLSENIKIGPDLAFELGIIYAVLASTGTPRFATPAHPQFERTNTPSTVKSVSLAAWQLAMQKHR